MSVRRHIKGVPPGLIPGGKYISMVQKQTGEEILMIEKYRHGTYLIRVVVLVLACFGVASSLVAQTAEIRIDVTDNTGAVMVGVPIVVMNTETGVQHISNTDSAGVAVAPALQPGSYLVSATFSGFMKQEHKLGLTVGQVAAVKLVMALEGATQTVEVTQAAGLEIQTTKSDVSGIVTRAQLDNLPVLNRGFIGLAQLLPGGAPSLSTDSRFGTQTTFGGANVRSGYSVLIDGTDVDHPIYGLAIVDVNQDAVQEFRVFHNQYDAEYSRAGTAVVNVVTRSGTNTYTGMFSYFGQNQALNARNYYVTTPQPPYSQTHTSATFGGPIIKDKTHFFFADEYLNQTSSFVEALPASNPFATTYNGVYPGSTNEKTIQTKVDHQLKPSDNLSIRYLWESQKIRQSYQLTDNYNIAFNDGVLQWGHILTPSILNNAQLEYMDQNTLRYQTATGAQIIRPSFTSGSPSNLPQGYPRRRIGLNDTFYWTKGRNTMKMGTRMAYEALHQQGNFYGAGSWTFNTNTPFAAGVPSTYPIAYTAGSGASDKEYKNAELGYFFQDDVKLSSRLTLNAGLRYDLETNLRNNRYLNKLLSNPAYPGLSTFVTPGRGNYLKAVQPRLGLAYDLFGRGTTVLRAAYGGYAARNRPFFDTSMQATDDNFTVQITNPTLLATYPSQTAVLGGLTLQQYVALNGGRSLYLVGDHLNIPYIYELTVGVQKSLFHNTVLTIDGIRQIQTGLQSGRDANLPTVGPLSSHPRPLPQYGVVTIFNSSTSAYYSALQMQLKSQYKRASLQASYTWSKSISDGLDDNSGSVSDPFARYGNNDRGIDEEDRRSTLALTSLLNLPLGIQASGIVTLTTGTPWNITYGKDFDGDGNTQDRPAGLSKDVGGRSRSSDLTLINAARTSTTSTTLPSGLVVPALNSATCASTNSCLGPVTLAQLNQSTGAEKIDLRLTKAFNFKERYRLELFMEAYNLLNTPSFLAPSGVISSPSFLQRSAANSPRQMQWGARFNFKAK